MTQLKDNANAQTGKHLTCEKRVKIKAYKALDYSNREIGRILNRVPQTINNAVKRGTVRTIKQRQKRDNKVYEYDQYSYPADADQQIYILNRQHSGRRPKWLLCDSFTDWADTMMLDEGWSPDIVIGRAPKEERFAGHLIPCTSTLYNWIDWGIMKTKNMDIFEKVSRKPRDDSPKHRENRRVFGPSIEERPEEVELRNVFGHWEIDILIGVRDKDDPVLLTLVERKTRFEMIIKIGKQNQPKVDQAMHKLYKQLGHYAEKLFKTITSDNNLNLLVFMSYSNI